MELKFKLHTECMCLIIEQNKYYIQERNFMDHQLAASE